MSYLPLGDSLLALLPDAAIIRCRTQDWHSATFSGQRVSVQLAVGGSDSESRIERFKAVLGDHEFALPGQWVADICVADQRAGVEGSAILTVEALLLGDDA